MSCGSQIFNYPDNDQRWPICLRERNICNEENVCGAVLQSLVLTAPHCTVTAPTPWRPMQPMWRGAPGVTQDSFGWSRNKLSISPSKVMHLEATWRSRHYLQGKACFGFPTPLPDSTFQKNVPVESSWADQRGLSQAVRLKHRRVTTIWSSKHLNSINWSSFVTLISNARVFIFMYRLKIR